jgi:hypothetical protein
MIKVLELSTAKYTKSELNNTYNLELFNRRTGKLMNKKDPLILSFHVFVTIQNYVLTVCCQNGCKADMANILITPVRPAATGSILH